MRYGEIQIIRHANPADIAGILELQDRTEGAAHWGENSYRAVFEPGPQRILLVAEDQCTQGFLMARLNPPECELENIVVSENYRRRGVASQLLKELITAAREHACEKILLEVRESNAIALSLYRSFGFVETGRRKSYYREPVEDAVLLTLLL